MIPEEQNNAVADPASKSLRQDSRSAAAEIAEVSGARARALVGDLSLALTKHRLDSQRELLTDELDTARERLSQARHLRLGAAVLSPSLARKVHAIADRIIAEEREALAWAKQALDQNAPTTKNKLNGGRPRLIADFLWVMGVSKLWEEYTGQAPKAYLITGESGLSSTPFVQFLAAANGPWVRPDLVRRAVREYTRVKAGKPSKFRELRPEDGPAELICMSYGYTHREVRFPLQAEPHSKASHGACAEGTEPADDPPF